MKKLILLLSLLIALPLYSQYKFYTPSDSVKLEEVIQQLPFNSITQIAEQFLGVPYQEKMLNHEPEVLLLTGSHMDCQIYVETVLALFKLQCLGDKYTLSSYAKQLAHIRYRDGNSTEYTSRLHYFTDWIYENQKNGKVKDVTREMGGEKYPIQVNFMTTHRTSYIPLKQESNYKRMQRVEHEINKRHYYYIPKNKIDKIANNIHDGDIIAITTSVQGLDIAHVGFAHIEKNKLYFLHASSSKKAVVVTQVPLTEYLRGNRTQTGIMVLRPRV